MHNVIKRCDWDMLVVHVSTSVRHVCDVLKIWCVHVHNAVIERWFETCPRCTPSKVIVACSWYMIDMIKSYAWDTGSWCICSKSGSAFTFVMHVIKLWTMWCPDQKLWLRRVSRIQSHGVIETYLCSAWSIWLKDDLDEVPRCNFSEVHAAFHMTLITLKKATKGCADVQTHAWSAATRLPSRQMSEHWRIECCKRVNWRVLGEVC